MKSSTKKLEN